MMLKMLRSDHQMWQISRHLRTCLSKHSRHRQMHQLLRVIECPADAIGTFYLVID